jgi:uncharacterized protein (TIGR02147 family)
MERTLFEFQDYKRYLLTYLEQLPGKGRGVRREMAEAMSCQTAYVSHVLAGNRHLSLEQAEALTRLFGMRVEEAEYFVLLVEHNRAGTPQLRKFLDRRLEQLRSQNQQLKARVGIKAKISPADQAVFYSSWHYQAIRVALTIPELRTLPKLAKRLKIPLGRVQEVMQFLLEHGLAQEKSGEYLTTDTQNHLPGDSPLVSKLHSNWRIHSLQSFDRNLTNDFHYSGAVTLSSADMARVREILTQALVNSHNVIRPSKEERLCVLNMDFYVL